MTAVRPIGLAVLCLGALVAVGPAGAVDGTPPAITFEVVGTEGANGWYVSPTTVRWRVDDPESGIKSSSGCDATTLVADTGGTRLTCSATNMADVTSTVSLTVKIDRTPPAVTGVSPDRPPDSSGWYTRAVTFAFAGTDETSGVASCTSVTYAGPDSGYASVSGTCADRAGNVSAPSAVGFRFDTAAPALRGVVVHSGDGEVTVEWTALPPWEWVELVRSIVGRPARPRTVFRGSGSRYVDRRVRNGIEYRYGIIGRDGAGHATQANVEAIPVGPLRTPLPGATITSPPRLTWKAVRGAALYNVQLFRGSRKILSAWPRGASIRLTRSWRYGGHRRRLVPGRYRWYVWPAFRQKGGVRFGRLIGRSTFVVTRR
jgi:hypothetical protein